jgi:CheY-like chemotaxis protein
MLRPVLLAVDDEPAARSSIEKELRKRYGADYEVICEGSGAAALGALERVKARSGKVALVPADQWMPDMTGIELLYEWAQLYRPGFQAVQVVGEQWSARAHELRTCWPATRSSTASCRLTPRRVARC